MLEITITLIPRGHREHARTLTKGTIRNMGTGTPSRGNYEVKLTTSGQVQRLWREQHIFRFPRTKYSAWYLLQDALNATLPERKQSNISWVMEGNDMCELICKVMPALVEWE